MPPDSHDTRRHWMRRAIHLAMNGRGRVEPNPMVGCVITTPDGRSVLGEGYHQAFGGLHAEANALAACVAAGNSPAGATAYTTLEPCCHLNKPTPRCAARLIEAKVGRVVVGCIDPDPDVNGKGVRLLREAGIDVVTEVLEPECRQLLAPFIAQTVHRRPYVTLKWAETADGKVAGPGGRPIRITNDPSDRLVHELRGRCDAILIGVGTLLTDNPRLTARVPPARHILRKPLRVVLDSRLRGSAESELAKTARESPVLIFYNPRRADFGKAAAFRERGVELFPIESEGPMPLEAVLVELHSRNVTHVLVEPGPELAVAFLATPLTDRLWVFRSAYRIDDPTAPAAAAIPAGYVETATMVFPNRVENSLTEYLNPDSHATFAAAPSADFLMSIGRTAG